MNRSVFVRYVFPFFQWYILMIIVALGIDYALHVYKLVNVGRYLGYFGTGIILVSFVYSLRKRKIISSGNPKSLLLAHEYMAWIGSVLILVHAGIHFNALLPWLAIVALLVNVASGLVGKFLLKKSVQTLKEKQEYFTKSGLSKEEVENKLYYDSIMVDAMKKWRSVHLPFTAVLGILSALHIITVLIF
ncbi:MAG: hypothetical protein U0X76_02645 [Bacteroidia bacterium]